MPQLLIGDTYCARDDVTQIHVVEPVVEGEIIPVN